MKSTLFLLVVALMASPLLAVQTVAIWNFEDGIGSPVAADTSGVGVAADGTLSGGAAIVADPLGVRSGGVLYVADGGLMNTPQASEPKFDSTTYGYVSFWAYCPTPVIAGVQGNDWWELTMGKGYSGSPRVFLDSQAGLTVDYLFSYADVLTGDGRVVNLAPGAWGAPQEKSSGWHFYEAEVYPNEIDGVAGFASILKIDGTLYGYADTQSLLEFDVVGFTVNDDVYRIGGNGWEGYIDDVTVIVPEPCTMLLLGLGGLLAARRK